MKKFLRNVLVGSGALLLGMMLVFVVYPKVYKYLPSDHSRHKVVIDAFNNKELKPDIVFFGSSLGVYGINANVIKDSTTGHPEVLNCACFGQNLTEASYFYSQVPKSTKHIIHCINIYDFLMEPDLWDIKAINMIFSGYELTDETLEIVGKPHPYFEKSIPELVMKSRENVKASLHVMLREVLDENEFNDNKNDLYYPHSFIKNRSNRYEFLLKTRNDQDSLKVCNKKFVVNGDKKALIKNINSVLKKRGIKYSIILMPINPDRHFLTKTYLKEMYKTLNKEFSELDIIDFTTLMYDNNYFYDDLHANKKGCELISEEVAKVLNERGEW